MTNPTTAFLLFDERMALHRPPQSSKKKFPDEETDVGPYENSSRITHLYQKMLELENRLLSRQSLTGKTVSNSQTATDRRFIPLQPTPCPRETIELAHSRKHYEHILRTCELSNHDLRELTVDDDLYFCRDTFLAASLACGGVVNCVDAVMDSWETGSGPTRAVALVRPPGHHATRDEAMGFCYFNNIAVAAKHVSCGAQIEAQHSTQRS